MLEEALSPLTEVLNTDVDGVFGVIASNVPLHRWRSPDEISGPVQLPGQRRLLLHDRFGDPHRRRFCT